MAAPKVKPSRDSVTTIREDGSRLILHPADVAGPITTARRLCAWLLVALFFALPFIRVGGHPAVFFDIGARRFHLLGTTLAFQDAWLLFFLITGLGFTLFFITSLLGRIWCGWTCPQTVFLEHVFRRIERLLEGDAPRRRALDAAPWTAGKIARRTLKQVLFFGVAVVIAHGVIAYFVSIPVLWGMVWQAPGEHWSVFVFVWVFALVIYFNFAWFREQLCLIICPYGRLQSALIDDNTMVVGYDEKRGEPRGRVGKEGVGDCINCNRCVDVCPTGIDIRQGLQIECISCAACIDACNAIMLKINRPKGLIRHDSIEGLAGKKTRWMRPRTVIYALLLALGVTVTAFALLSIQPVVVGVTRMTGASYVIDADAVRNQFLVRLVNKRDHPVRVHLRIDGGGTALQQAGFGEELELQALEEIVQPLVLRVPFDDYEGRFRFSVNVVSEGDAGGFAIAKEAEFVGPNARLLKEDLQQRAARRAEAENSAPAASEVPASPAELSPPVPPSAGSPVAPLPAASSPAESPPDF